MIKYTKVHMVTVNFFLSFSYPLFLLLVQIVALGSISILSYTE